MTLITRIRVALADLTRLAIGAYCLFIGFMLLYPPSIPFITLAAILSAANVCLALVVYEALTR